MSPCLPSSPANSFVTDASVSKQKDTSRVISSAAYLLFYRRRSEGALGGPRFQEIFDRYNNQSAADEDMSDSGEGQRLGQGSSHRGSPSALTGAGLILPHANRGLARLAADPEQLPSYQSSINNADDDTEMGAHLSSWSNQDTLHNSIEGGDGDEDEGIGLSDFDSAGLAGMTSVIGPSNWSFDNLNSKANSEVGDGDDADIASDVAQNDSDRSVNGDEDVFDTGDMAHMLGAEPGSDYMEPPEPVPDVEFQEYEVPPEPSNEAQNYMGRIAAETWAKRHQEQEVHAVLPAELAEEDDRASEKVAEIHVGDGEEGRKPVA
jgi:ubiquitin carboxyl-terminal hydrolase 4/11/15